MESLIDFLDARHSTCEQFSAQHPYPFLIMDAGADVEKRAFAFLTEASSGAMARRHLKSLNELHREGKRLSKDAEATIVFRVRKRPGGLFPERISVGRTLASDVVIADRRVSKMQAYFEDAERTLTLIDAGSRNGTRVNGRALQAGERTTLSSGDTVEFPPFALRVLGAAQLFAIVRQHIEQLAVEAVKP